jgi:hypothetical protein
MLVVVALLSQIIAATGAPVLSPRKTKAGAIPFPCQNHPCGCTTSEEGWAGDCCCFTLEQKLAWADERGIEPPAHVRPMVEARKAATLKQKAKPSCCATLAKSEKRSCCEGETHTTCPTEQPATATVPAVKWVAGFFAQKCRGEGPAGLLKLEVSVSPELPCKPPAPLPARDLDVRFDSHAVTISFCPPTPPPRLS